MRLLNIEIKHYSAQVEALAAILAQRDSTREELDASGARSIVDGGGMIPSRKNPLLSAWDDLNKTALSYWRELGLTPSSYRKLADGSTNTEKAPTGLAAALANLEE